MLKNFLVALQALGTPDLALAHQKYHKSSRSHWGVTNPDKRKLISGVVKELPEADLIKFSQELWETNLFDPMICAALILTEKKVKPCTKLWKTIVRFLKDVDGWALEDTLAHAAWKCILADETLLDEVETWTKHSDFWMRRAALVYTLPYAKPGKNPERSLKWAASYVNDREWFIQKAIGWWLRVLSEHNPKRVLKFVREHEQQLMYVAKKEAQRKI